MAVDTAGWAGYLEPGDRLEARRQASGPFRPEPSRTLDGAHTRRPMGSIPPGPVPPSSQGCPLSAADDEAIRPDHPATHARRFVSRNGRVRSASLDHLCSQRVNAIRGGLVELVTEGGRRRPASGQIREEQQDHGTERDTS